MKKIIFVCVWTFWKRGSEGKILHTQRLYWVYKYLCLIMFLSYLFPPFSLNIHKLTLRDIISPDHVHLGQIKCWTPLKNLEGKYCTSKSGNILTYRRGNHFVWSFFWNWARGYELGYQQKQHSISQVEM